MNLSKAQRQLFWFGLLKIPMIGFVKPRIIELNENKLVLKIPLRRRSKNHLNSLYIAGFTIGADLATGFLAVFLAQKLGLKVAPVFKSFSAEYIKRAETDTYFICEAGPQITAMLKESSQTSERVNKEITIPAYTGYPNNLEMVADLKITLSVKVKG